MQVWRDRWPQGGLGACEALWRAVRGIYRGEFAETRARRWWSRRDREVARKSLRLIEARMVVAHEEAEVFERAMRGGL